MTRYIKSFANDAAIQTAVDDGVLGHPYVALDDDLHKIDWDKKGHINYFRITNRTNTDGIITLKKSGVAHNLVIRTRVNGSAWSPDTTYSETSTIELPANGYVEFDGRNNSYFSASITNYWNFVCNVNFDISGDLHTLVSARTVTHNYEFTRLFSGSNTLINASGLTMGDMVLKDGCYQELFANCTNTETAPVLQAKTLVTNCFANMFLNDGKINYIKCLATSQTGTASLSLWLKGTSSTGTFVKDENATFWTRGNSGIPRNWTVINA